jgi:nifR3 family TIM-barrel protein
MIRLTEACVRSTTLPVTVKTRLGWDDNSKNIVEVAERLQDAGVRALTIHGRTRCQLYKGEADWRLIADVKNNPRMHIPIFGNGDIDSPQKALEYRNRYGVDGIMIGRAAIGYPWIFREIKHYLETGRLMAGPSAGERVAVCRQHLAGALSWNGPVQGLNEMRGRYGQYLRGLPDIGVWLKQLVRLANAEAVSDMLQEIGAAYPAFTPPRQPAERINYHLHCTL